MVVFLAGQARGRTAIHSGLHQQFGPWQGFMTAAVRCPYLRHIIALAVLSVTFCLQGDPARLQSLSRKVFCNCGCGEILAECSHLDCKRKSALKREISSSIIAGKDDQTILDELGA
jgi:hypothetical protein